MGQLSPITDPNDERVADYAVLTDARLRKRYEHRTGVLIAEGPNPVRELLRSDYPVRSLLIAEERVGQFRDIVDAIEGPVYTVTRDVLYGIVRFKLHQGVIACGARLPSRAPARVVAATGRIAVLEGLNDHENLGTIFRSARALGIGGILLGPGCADPLYRRSVRTSMGHVLHVPHARIADLGTAFGLLTDAGFTCVALTPDPGATPLRELEVLRAERIAVLLGAEGPGLSDRALDGAQVQARIPMHSGVDSLNVASAAAIAFQALAPDAPLGDVAGSRRP